MDWLFAEVGTEMSENFGGLERKQTEGMMSLQILKWNTVTSGEWSRILPTQFLELWNNYSNSVWYLGRTVCHFLFKFFCKWELMLLCVLEHHASCSTEKVVCGKARLYCLFSQFLYQAWLCNFGIILQYELKQFPAEIGALLLLLLLLLLLFIFLHGLGRLTCSGIDALPSFPGASAIIINIIIIEFLTSQLWLGNIHLSWDVVINYYYYYYYYIWFLHLEFYIFRKKVNPK